MRLLKILALLSLTNLACTQGEPVDLLFHNGKIVTVDDDFSIHEAIAVRDGKVLAVGGAELVNSYDATRVVDLGGKLLMPGFNDTHIHIRGRARRAVVLTDLESIEEIKRRVRAKAEELGAGEWITGYGWSEDELDEGRRPLRWDLDEAAPDNPVILTRAGGHSAVANSMALELADVTAETPQPEGGVIEHDNNGELNGVIRERQRIVSRLVPDATPEELRETFVQSLRDLLPLGITSIIQAGVRPDAFGEWESVYEEFGEELPRAAVQVRFPDAESVRAFPKKTGDGDARLRVGAVKVSVDGGFTGPAAYTLDPYKGEESYRGTLNLSEEELRDIVTTAHGLGWQLGFHAIGDAAIVLTVAAFTDAIDAQPRDDHRHFLNHFTVMPPDETMQQMAEYDIFIAQQPNFTYTLEGRYAANLEDARLAHNNALRSPMDHGVFVALGSDILPIGPMVGIYAAVTRKGMSGKVYGAEEKLTMEEAIRGYTAYGAYFTWEEDTKGTLAPGMLADMIVLSEDLLTIDPEKILDVQVEMTVVDGKVLFERN